MPILLEEDRNITLPSMHKVRQIFPRDTIVNIEEELLSSLNAPNIRGKVFQGQRVALAVGSRGIAGIQTVVRTAAEFLLDLGAEPFVVSAMGSHGGGSEAGQRAVLESYGITEEELGIPVITKEDTVLLGSIECGGGKVQIFTDEAASKADMTILINRIKPHTDFNGAIESGLCKMAVIGLGKHQGCSEIHKEGFPAFPRLIPKAAEFVFSKGNIGFGIGVVENAYDEIALIKTIPAERILEEEPGLLDLAKNYMGKILFPDFDILILEEIGKNISGGGADTNIIGRYGPKALSSSVPSYKCLIVLGLSEETHGNAAGIGMADFVTKKVLQDIDFVSTYANYFAVNDGFETAFIPMVMENEEEALICALKRLGFSPENVAEEARILKLKNTGSLEWIEVSKALLPYAKVNPLKFSVKDRKGD